MKKTVLLTLLFAILLTACGKEDKVDPNAAGNVSGINGLNGGMGTEFKGEMTRCRVGNYYQTCFRANGVDFQLVGNVPPMQKFMCLCGVVQPPVPVYGGGYQVPIQTLSVVSQCMGNMGCNYNPYGYNGNVNGGYNGGYNPGGYNPGYPY